MIYPDLSAVFWLLKTSSCLMDNGFGFKKPKSIKNISPKSPIFKVNQLYFHSRFSKSKEVAPFEAIEEGTIVFTSPWFFSPHNDPFNRIKAKTSLTFNQVDLEKGRHFWISRHLSMRPSVGIRGYWTRTTFSVHGKSPLEALTFDSVAVENQTKIKQKSWGVGLLDSVVKYTALL